MNNWTAWVGVKFGTLTVEKYLGYQDRGSAYFLVRCDCGKTKKVTIWEFKKGKEKSCGLLRCKAKVKGLTGTPKPPETITQQDETASALETRLKPKYYCRAVTPDCVISTLLHICCCECDRPCKRCENTPQKCGAWGEGEKEELKEVEEHGTSRKAYQGC